jgi:hypothetical protein
MDMLARQVGIAVCAVLAMTSVALAQTSTSPNATNPSATAPATTDSKACARGAADAPTQNLSDKLSQTNGVICPPNVDPDIKAPTPDAGKMPVIPPPGSPGGNPTVQPK